MNVNVVYLGVWTVSALSIMLFLLGVLLGALILLLLAARTGGPSLPAAKQFRPATAPIPAPTPAPATPAPATPAAEPRTHTITYGDTLTKISQKYYGTPKRWNEILAANRDVLRDDKNLVVGRKLVIP